MLDFCIGYVGLTEVVPQTVSATLNKNIKVAY